MKKKFLSVLGLVAIFFTLVPMTAFAVPLTLTVNALTTDDTTPALTGNVSDNASTLSVVIKQGGVAVGNPYTATNNANGTWTLANNTIAALAVGTYVAEVTATPVLPAVPVTVTGQLVIADPISVSTYTLNGSLVSPYTWSFDPTSSLNAEEYLTINYSLSIAPESLDVNIKNSSDEIVKYFTATPGNLQTGSFVWDGVSSNKLVEPGNYKVIISSTKTGFQDVTVTKYINVQYINAEKPAISSINVNPSSFNPESEDTFIQFTNTKEADITVEIRDSVGETKRIFSNYSNDNYTSGSTHSIPWDGTDDSGNRLSNSTYKVFVIARNTYGVDLKQSDVVVTGTTSTNPTSNDHISGISFNPSSIFKPGVDDELLVEYDVLPTKLDELKIYAVRGSEQIELSAETNVSKESNLEVTWDGMKNDGDYADEGTWKIQFKSKLGATNLIAAKSIEIRYDKPTINDFFVSHTKFDNDLGEYTYAVFRVDKDAKVTLYEMQGSSEDDTIEEDMEVSGGHWYAIQWDGGSYDYSDSVSLKLKVMNQGNENIFNTEKISVDLAENTTSSSKSRISNYSIDPIVTDGNMAMEVFYELDDDATVTVSVLKGKSTTGSNVIDLVNSQEQTAGSHTISWNGRDKNDNKLSKGIYTLKIVSKKSSTDTKYVYFVVGTVGDVSGSSTSSSSSSGNGISSAVTVDGGGTGNVSAQNRCANFTDVDVNSNLCTAITWAKSKGIFSGYSDGSFRAYQTINRAEALKVILVALNVSVPTSVSGNLGFNDVKIGEWYMAYIKTAKDRGIFSGDSGKSTARPDANVNRVELLKFMFEGLKSAKSYYLKGSCYTSPYSDLDAGAWYYKYACESKQYSLFASPDGYSLDKGAYGTRGEVASALYKLHLAGLL